MLSNKTKTNHDLIMLAGVNSADNVRNQNHISVSNLSIWLGKVLL